MSSRKKKYITLNSSQVNAGVITQYTRALLKLVKQMTTTYTKELLAMYKDNEQEVKEIRTATDESLAEQYQKRLAMLDEVYAKYFTKYGKQAAEEMVAKTARLQQTSFVKEYAKFMFLMLNAKVTRPEDKIFADFMKKQFAPQNFMPTPEGKKAFMEAFLLNTKPYNEITETIKQTTITNNVELIKSIHQQYHREISQALYDSIINGKPQRIVSEAIQKAGAKTKRRARLIAQDQCNKIHSTLQLQEMKQVGIKKAKWIHMGGGKTDRKTHITDAPYGLNGAIFDIEKGIYDPTVQQYIKPAELPFCRCRAVGIAEV